jgi:NAD(P)H-quinone oxidoreductase subunit 5
VNPLVMTLVGLALLAGPMGKCAQFPLHLWLDEAMEGPVPGTILRNAIVVQVGAWVLVKLAPVYALSPVVMTTMVVIGAVSAVGGTLIAIAQIDIKRTMSYPTTAYMGLVFISVGMGQTQAALLLSLAHALAMALLVMGSSAVVWNSVTQDVTQLGGLWKKRPVSGGSLVIGAAGLVAMPPLGGFWAMLKLVEGLWVVSPWMAVLVVLINGGLAFSFTRLFCLVCLGKPNVMTERSPEVHWPMAVPMIVMMGLVLHLPIVLNSLGLLPGLNLAVASGLSLSTFCGLIGGVIVYTGDRVEKPVQLPSKALQDLFTYDFYTPQLYKNTVIGGVALLARGVNWVDTYLVDGVANLMGTLMLIGGQSLKYSTSGQSQFYMLTVMLGISVLGIWLCLPFLGK